MSNQLGNHKNVLGSSSQGWSIILVPALPGLPIHPFLAETLCLTIALSYKKKKKSPCHGQMFCTGPFSSWVLFSYWCPMGKDVRMCICTFSHLWFACFVSEAHFCPYSSLSVHTRSFLPPSVGLSQKVACVHQLENWKGRMGKEVEGRASCMFHPFPHPSISLLDDFVAHTVGCQYVLALMSPYLCVFLPRGPQGSTEAVWMCI